MSRATGVKMIPTLFVVAVVAAAAYVVLPKFVELINRADSPYVITVDFDPELRSGEIPAGRTLIDQVSISVTVGPSKFPKEAATRSPWTMPVYPQENREQITVRAEQFYGNRLQCEITVNGKRVARDQRSGPSVVSCNYTVRM